MFPGSSKEEIILDAIAQLKSAVDSSDLPATSATTDALNSATALLSKDDHTTTRLPQRVVPPLPPADSLQRVVAPSEGVTPPLASSDVLRRPKRSSKRGVADPYRPLVPAERKQPKFRAYLSRVGQHFRDTESNEVLVIDSVVMPTKLKGPGSNTPYYKMFLSTQFFRSFSFS